MGVAEWIYDGPPLERVVGEFDAQRPSDRSTEHAASEMVRHAPQYVMKHGEQAAYARARQDLFDNASNRRRQDMIDAQHPRRRPIIGKQGWLINWKD